MISRGINTNFRSTSSHNGCNRTIESDECIPWANTHLSHLPLTSNLCTNSNLRGGTEDYYWCYTKALQRHVKLSRSNEVVHFHRDLPIRWKKCNNPCNTECHGVCCGCKNGQCWSRCDWLDQIPKCYTYNFVYNMRQSWCHTANACSIDSDCNLNNAECVSTCSASFISDTPWN